MATHSSILALKIPWNEEPVGRYSPWGHKESDTTEQLHFLFTFFLLILTIKIHGKYFCDPCYFSPPFLELLLSVLLQHRPHRHVSNVMSI